VNAMNVHYFVTYGSNVIVRKLMST